MTTNTTHTNYCEHGTYVGGCGIDYMCQWCEDGIFGQEYVDHINALARQRVEAKIADGDAVIAVAKATGVNPTVMVNALWSDAWLSPWLINTATKLGII